MWLFFDDVFFGGGEGADEVDGGEGVVFGLIHGLDFGGRGDDAAFGDDAGEVLEFELSFLIPVGGEEASLVVAEFAVVGMPSVVSFDIGGIASGILGDEFWVDGFEYAGEVVFDGEVAVGFLDTDVEGDNDHVADAELFSGFESAGGGEALVAAFEGETFAEGLEGFGVGPGFDGDAAAQGIAFGEREGEEVGLGLDGLSDVDGIEEGGEGVVGGLLILSELEREGLWVFWRVFVGGEAEEDPGVAEGGAPVAVGFA